MNLYERYPQLKPIENDIQNAVSALIDTYANGGKLLVCGNGGSCADCDHIVGELMKGFLLKRKPDKSFKEKLEKSGFTDSDYLSNNLQGALPAISLTAQTAISTAFLNDVEPDMIYAQLVYGYGVKNDALICISTSGNAQNTVNAAKIAKALGVKTIALTGAKESKLSEICDITIKAPQTETYKIQELHLPIYHYICAELEKKFFKE